MRNKTGKILSILVALFMLVSGMYFDNFEIDFLFACAPTETSDSNILSADNAIADEQACNEEMLGVKGISNTYQSRNTKISPDFLSINFLSLDEGKFYVSLDEIHFVSPNQNESVTSYIHKSDGKKRD